MEKTTEETLAEIKSNLTGDAKKDQEYLQSCANDYADREDVREILTGISYMIFETLADEEKAQFREAAEQDLMAYALIAAHNERAQGNTDKALENILPLAKSLKEEYETEEVLKDPQYQYFALLDDSPVKLTLLGITDTAERELRELPVNVTSVFFLCASILYDLQRHEEAIAWLEEALLFARSEPLIYFEISENYKKMGDLDKADEWSDKAYPYVADPSMLARWYRSKGFCETERKHYSLAAAYFFISNKLELSPQALSEIEYINHMAGDEYMKKNFNTESYESVMESSIAIFEKNDVPLSIHDTAIRALTIVLALAKSQHDTLLYAKTAHDVYILTGTDEAEKRYEEALKQLEAEQAATENDNAE